MTYIIFIIIIILLIVVFSKKYDSHENFVPVELLTDYKYLKQNKILMKKFHDLCDENDLTYWIIGGTMLGAIRDKGIIPWDDDLDVSMPEVDVNELFDIKQKLTDQKLGIAEWFGGYKVYDLNGSEIKGVNYKYPFIDIFVMTKNKNGNYIYKYKRAYELWPDEYQMSDVFPLKKYQFEDYEVYGMNNSIKFLDEHYTGWKNKGQRYYDHINQKASKKTEFSIDYNVNKKPYLWIYWDNIDGKSTPAYIDLCYDSITKNCSDSFDIVKLNKDNIKKYLPELSEYDKYFEKLRIAHKVDIYRIMLLYKYGGLYIDADTIVLRDPIEIMNKLKKYEFVGFGCTGDKCRYGYKIPSNGIMASRPNSILMGKVMMILIDRIKKLYDENQYDKVQYFDLGKLIIWDEIDSLIAKSDYEYYHYPNRFDGTRDVNGKWVTASIIFSNQQIEYEKEDQMIFLVLYNSEISKDVKEMTRSQLMNKQWNFSKYMKIALKSNDLVF